MAELNLTEAHRALIERFGVLHEELGFSPAPGRVLGLLLASPRPELTFDEIRDALALSKSSISGAINLLLRIGSIEYRTRPGERKRYFRKSYRNWEDSLIHRMNRFFAMRQLLVEAHALHESVPERSDHEIPRMIEFLDFLENSLNAAHERWTREHAAGESGPRPPRRTDPCTSD